MFARKSWGMTVSVTALGMTALLVGLAIVSSVRTDLAQLPGAAADRSDVIQLRAGEIKMYKQCVSEGTNCAYNNECKAGEDGSGCANSDYCTSCTGGTNAGCTGALGQTKCIDDTLKCCSLSKACKLTSSGCICGSAPGGAMLVGEIAFCSGS